MSLKKAVLLFLFQFAFIASLSASSSIKKWTKKYNRLVALLASTSVVGDCSLEITVNPSSPEGSNELHFIVNQEEIGVFDITPPLATGGRTQVDSLSRNVLRYRESDVVGWVNMNVQLDVKRKAIVGVELNKTLPNGEIYSKGIQCGSYSLDAGS